MTHEEAVHNKRSVYNHLGKWFRRKTGSKRTWRLVNIKIISNGISYNLEMVLRDDGEELIKTLEEFKQNYEEAE